LDPDVFVKWHAIRASEITTISDRDPQVAHRALKVIQMGHRGHYSVMKRTKRVTVDLLIRRIMLTCEPREFVSHSRRFRV
jgi:hypothetical protein